MGVGNELKEYDRIGVDVAKMGKELFPEEFIVGGLAPENFLGKIIKAKISTLIIVDGVYFDGTDSVRLLSPEDLTLQGISTHSLSLKLMAEYLKNYDIQTVIIGIKPTCLPRSDERSGTETTRQVNDDTMEVKKEVLSALMELIRNKNNTS